MVLGPDLLCNPLHGESDVGHSLVGNILAAAAIAAAGYNTVRAVQIANDEYKLAKKYWKIAQNWLDYYKSYYAPVEDQEVTEALALEEETPLYDVARGRARAIAWVEYRGVIRQTIKCTSKYCTGLRADMVADLTAAQADAVALADGLGYRNERGYIESRNDVRFDKMLNTAKRGRDMVADNVSLAQATAGIYGDLFEQTWQGLTGAGQYLGYWSSRNDVSYPTTYTQGRPQAYAASEGSGGPPPNRRAVLNEN